MANTQTRRTISVCAKTYQTMQRLSSERGVSMSSLLEAMIATEGGKPAPELRKAKRRPSYEPEPVRNSSTTPSERRESRNGSHPYGGKMEVGGRGNMVPTMPAAIDKRPDKRTRPAPEAAAIPARDAGGPFSF